MKPYQYIGHSLLREDTLDKVRGKTKYVADMQRHDMLYAKLYLSREAHADVTIDATAALNVEGMVAVFTNKDVPAYRYNSMEWFPGVVGRRDEQLLNDRARHFGDRLALLVGTSKQSVEKALSLLKVTYHSLPSVLSLDEAKRDEAIIKFDSNCSFEKTIAYGDYEVQKKQADLVVTDKGSTPKIHHSAIEPHVALAEIDDQGIMVVTTPCQAVFQVQMHVANILSLPMNRVRVIKAVMGGSFGGKSQPILEPIAAFAAMKLHRPVLLYMDRPDAIAGTVTRNATQVTVETALKKDGTILGRKVQAEFDGGSYDTNSTSILFAFAKKLFRLYRIPAQHFEGKSYFTNSVPGGACRAYGGPQSHAITEVNLDQAAQAIGMDPCTFRLKNLVEPYDEDPVGGPNLGNAKIKVCLEKGMEAFGWAARRSQVKAMETPRYAYGVGVACATHGNGYLGAYPDFSDVDMVMFYDGSVLVKVAVHEQGCGTLTSLQQIAAEALDMPPHRIRITEADTFITPYDSAGTQASRVTFVSGGAVKEAGEKLREMLMDRLCRLRNLDPEEISTKEGMLVVKSTGETISYTQVAAEAEKKFSEQMSVHIHHVPQGNPASFAAFFSYVRVDKYTGMVDLLDCVAVHDVGYAINPLLVEGQIQGGAQFSMGMALMEEITLDGRGRIKSENFSKYHILNTVDMPPVRCFTVEEGDACAPYGAKSVGEAATVAPAPSVLNAINHALGTRITRYPATAEIIVQAIQEKNRL